MQASEWAGKVGETWAEEWVRTDRTFVPVDAALVAAVTARLGERGGSGRDGSGQGARVLRLLDVGCGAGGTSLSLAAALPGARITGIDLSPALAAAARARAADAGGAVADRCRFLAADAAAWDGEDGFDCVVSRHGVMFFDDPVAAFAHIRARATPGAPIVFSCFRAPGENVWASGLAPLMPPPGDPLAPGPFAFADPRRVATIFTQAGWRDAAPQPLDFAYVAGAGPDPVADAIGFFRRIGPVARALSELDGSARTALADRLEALVRDHLTGGEVAFPAAAWIWSATA